MIAIDDAYVDSAAPNAEAAKNGRGLVLKNKFTRLHLSADETLLFGECQGSGDVNPRIRWDAMTPRPLEPGDFERIRGFGQPDFAAAVKEVKTHLKGPLADKQPILALNFKRLGRVGEVMVAEDTKGERLMMTDAGMAEEPSSCHLLALLPKACFESQTLIARFRHDLDTRKLQIKPLSIVTGGSRCFPLT
ncbi:MAG: hypothetical protein U0793_12290 [Gemmataceae bacterium]